MAAGEGRRLRPLTERYAKPVLPIDGRPVIATLARELAAAGCRRATVVVGHLADQVERLLGDGSAFGLELRYARQPQPDGSADAVARALVAGATAPFLAVAADTAFAPGDVAGVAAAFGASDAAGAMTARRRPGPGPGRAPVRFVGGRVERVVDDGPGSPLASAPLWALGQGLLPYLERLPGPPYELASAFQRAVDAGETVLGLEIGPTRDITRPLDVVEHNFRYVRSL
jgi:NDP-sugar pyrophosphorylase family protein